MEKYGEYVMWVKRKKMLKSYIVQSKTWEERAFAEDAARARVLGVGGCVWPPKSYSCTFCTREFRSAQALGGHMNVHRRDRARLQQSPSPPSLSSSEEKTGHQIMFPDYSQSEDHVETDLSVGLNSMFGQGCNKRPKASVSSSLKPCSNERLPALHSAEILEDLDLELRLGKPQKVV